MFCKVCLLEKPSSAFYASRRARCKECLKAESRKYRIDNIEYVRAYDRMRGSMPHRVAARAEYQKTEAFALRHYEANERWRAANPERKRAATIVKRAVARGRIAKLPCLVCGSLEVEAHHPAYSLPLAVVWLCNAHHRAAHDLTRKSKTLEAGRHRTPRIDEPVEA